MQERLAEVEDQLSVAQSRSNDLATQLERVFVEKEQLKAEAAEIETEKNRYACCSLCPPFHTPRMIVAQIFQKTLARRIFANGPGHLVDLVSFLMERRGPFA